MVASAKPIAETAIMIPKPGTSPKLSPDTETTPYPAVVHEDSFNSPPVQSSTHNSSELSSCFWITADTISPEIVRVSEPTPSYDAEVVPPAEPLHSPEYFIFTSQFVSAWDAGIIQITIIREIRHAKVFFMYATYIRHHIAFVNLHTKANHTVIFKNIDLGIRL